MGNDIFTRKMEEPDAVFAKRIKDILKHNAARRVIREWIDDGGELNPGQTIDSIMIDIGRAEWHIRNGALVLIGCEPDVNPCDFCTLDAICDTYGYKEGCSGYKEWVNVPALEVEASCKTCINCENFRPFMGTCRLKMGGKKNDDTCEDFVPLGGGNCGVKGCSCK